MPVVVVGAHPDETDRGVQSAVQLGILIGASVVRDLDDLHAGDGDAPAQRRLRLFAEVAEQDRAREARSDDVEGDGGIVAGFRRRRWTERLPSGVADGPGHPDPGGPETCPRRREPLEQALVGRLVGRPVDEEVDPSHDRG
ncbi:hypothetical protein [Microbacterium testaceum]|uniref:hypothetical protein n=1 Tax=Microbacterium testaceum TaxID=2033 RepID=UPI001CD94591|nr:hypothetical protein [Microbacterium testaceum]